MALLSILSSITDDFAFSYTFILPYILFNLVSDPVGTLLLIQWTQSRVERLAKFAIRHLVPWSTEDESGDDVGTTEIHLLGVNQIQNQKRDWDVLVIHDGGVGHEGNGSLHDPFTSSQYSQHFKFFADGSFSIPEDERNQKFKDDIVEAGDKIETYGDELLRQLNLDRAADSVKVRNVTVVEDSAINDGNDDTSLHNPVWEILERTEFWRQSAPERVNVRRVLLNADRKAELAQDVQSPEQADLQAAATPQAQVDAPFRILLIIGRNIVDKVGSSFWKYEERVDPDVIQKSLIQAIYHLKEIGHDPGVDLEILRPATFDELKTYLGFDDANPDSPKEQYDIIHVDMHGEMMPPKSNRASAREPYLIFTKGPLSEGPEVKATDLADILRHCTKTIIMNACNESSPTGQLGIRMVRTFLSRGISQVAASSYRLQYRAAKIFYQSFYVSFFLNGRDFNKAAADGRLALRKDMRRHKDEERDDHFVLWNWSDTQRVHVPSNPRKSSLLHRKMFAEVVCGFFRPVVAYLRSKAEEWHEHHADRYPMCSIHWNFGLLPSHIRYVSKLDIPSISLYTLEIEWFLRERGSIYLYPEDGETTFIYPRIQTMVHNMVRIWAETNFVAEVRVLQVERMLERCQKKAPRGSRWSKNITYEDVAEGGDWRWPPSRKSATCSPKAPEVNTMLIINGIEKLKPLNTLAKRSVLKRIEDVAKEIYARDGDNYYLITIGSLVLDEFTKLSMDYTPRNCGVQEKWADPIGLNLPLAKNIQLATWRHKVQ